MKFIRMFIITIAFLLIVNEQLIEASIGSGLVEMSPWEKVNEIIPKYSKFTVLDVETGKQFKVQRRAGSHHADVQPLTAKETKIMKEIYNGKWSWRRRAIIVLHNDKMIAASMHGMPHGAGALKNNFPGHFCIHFYGSTTHRTNYMDLSHKIMILKAADKLEDYVGNASPYEVIQIFVASLKEQDPFILNSVSMHPLKNKKAIAKIETINLNRMSVLPAEDHLNDLYLEVPVEIEVMVKNLGRKTFKGKIFLGRLSQMDAWKIDTSAILNKLKKSDNERHK